MTGRRRLLAGAIVLAVHVAALLPGPALGAAPDPRVVFVVGPVGGLTETYRDWARAGATEARRWTDDVVELYSPNATWPKVRAALQGASIVVYLGHGNGFPSPHGSEPRPAVQNGFGLNPVAGRGDTTHQYFGESTIARQVNLAPGAVVLLFHLCYASGNSEPGVPEGGAGVARQRIDNFAAGFMAAGASAVVADAYASPAPYIRALLKSNLSARAAWTRAGTANGNVQAFPSDRTPGAVALMDPERTSSGFTRSIVLAAGATGAVPAGPGGGSEPPGGWELVVPPDPTSAPDAFALGAQPGIPTIDALPLAGTTTTLGVPVDVPPGVRLGTAYHLGTRWIPLDEPTAPADGQPGPATDSPTELLAPEAAASLVDVAEAATRATVIEAPITLPPASGRYRLEVTMHDADGVALPHAVQESIPGVIVHVGGPGAAWLDVPASVEVTAGSQAAVQVIVTNGEASPWGTCPVRPGTPALDALEGCPVVRLVGRWVPLGDGEPTAPILRTMAVPAGSAVTTWLAGSTPVEPGTYLLVATLERTVATGGMTVLGRPVAITVVVSSSPLLPPEPTSGTSPSPAG